MHVLPHNGNDERTLDFPEAYTAHGKPPKVKKKKTKHQI